MKNTSFGLLSLLLLLGADAKPSTFQYSRLHEHRGTYPSITFATADANQAYGTENEEHLNEFNKLVKELSKNDQIDSKTDNWDMAVLNGLAADGWEVLTASTSREDSFYILQKHP